MQMNPSLRICIITLAIILLSCSNNKNPLEPTPLEFDTFHGQIQHELASAVLKPDRTLWMWGHNSTGVLGDSTLQDNYTPSQVQGLENITTFELVDGIALASDNEGNIWFWGKMIVYFDPANPVPPIPYPVKISKLSGVVQIEVMHDFLLLRNDGTIWRLDWNWRKPSQWLEPERITDIENVKQISGALALLDDESLRLIDPVDFPITGHGGLSTNLFIKNIKQVEGKYNRRTVILKNDGTVWAWGSGNFGENGDGTLENRSYPVKVKNLENIIQISANYSYTLALKADGTIWYWGLTGDAKDTFTGIATPVKVEGVDNCVLVHANNTCLLKKQDGSYWGFGTESPNWQSVKVLQD